MSSVEITEPQLDVEQVQELLDRLYPAPRGTTTAGLASSGLYGCV